MELCSQWLTSPRRNTNQELEVAPFKQCFGGVFVCDRVRSLIEDASRFQNPRPSGAWTGHPLEFVDVLRTGCAGGLPLFYFRRELVVGHWDRGSTFAGVPSPHHQLIFREVLDQLVEVPVSVLLRVFDRPAKLCVSQALPDHGRAGRR